MAKDRSSPPVPIVELSDDAASRKSDVAFERLAQTTLDAFETIVFRQEDLPDKARPSEAESVAVRLGLLRASLWAWCLSLICLRDRYDPYQIKDALLQRCMRKELNYIASLLHSSLDEYGLHEATVEESSTHSTTSFLSTQLLARSCNDFFVSPHPRQRRIDSPARVWRYEGPMTADFDVFLQDLRVSIGSLCKMTECLAERNPQPQILEFVIPRIHHRSTLQVIKHVCYEVDLPNLATAVFVKLSLMGCGRTSLVGEVTPDTLSEATVGNNVCLKKSESPSSTPVSDQMTPHATTASDSQDPSPTDGHSSNHSNGSSEAGGRSCINITPTWIRVKHKYLDPRTLDVYQLPWIWDKYDTKFLIIQKFVNDRDQDILFEHTRMLREKDNQVNPEFSSEQHLSPHPPPQIVINPAPRDHTDAKEVEGFVHVHANGEQQGKICVET